MYNPELPVLFKKIVGPSTYSLADGYTVSLEELKHIAMVFQAGPIIGNDGSYIVIKDYAINGDTATLHFGKLVADTNTGAITVADLDDGSNALEGVMIPLIAVGDTTSMEVAPEAPAE